MYSAIVGVFVVSLPVKAGYNDGYRPPVLLAGVPVLLAGVLVLLAGVLVLLSRAPVLLLAVLSSGLLLPRNVLTCTIRGIISSFV